MAGFESDFQISPGLSGSDAETVETRHSAAHTARMLADDLRRRANQWDNYAATLEGQALNEVMAVTPEQTVADPVLITLDI